MCTKLLLLSSTLTSSHKIVNTESASQSLICVVPNNKETEDVPSAKPCDKMSALKAVC
jgi:hypothetical protein